MENTLNALNIFPNKYETYLFVKRFDRDSDGRLDFNEFAELILPMKKEFENLVAPKPFTNRDIHRE